jgi:mycoredoxin
MKQLASEPIVIYSAVWCGDCRRAKRFLDTQGVSYVAIDVEHDSEALAVVERLNNGRRSIPTIIFPDGAMLVEPSNAELAAKLGLYCGVLCPTPVNTRGGNPCALISYLAPAFPATS